MACVGFGKQCTNVPNVGFDYCRTCFDQRTQHVQSGFCSAKHGTCHNRHVRGKSWCYSCFRRSTLEADLKAAERELRNHDCSYRGGCACSVCDDLFERYEQAKEALNKFHT